MKIRTDFVTNSSSSNFTLEISIFTKNGDHISYSVDPSEYDPDNGGNAAFEGDLRRLAKVPLINHLYKLDLSDFVLMGTEFGGRAQRIEEARDGDPVHFELLVKRKERQILIDVCNEDGSLGYLPSHVASQVAALKENYEVELQGLLVKNPQHAGAVSVRFLFPDSEKYEGIMVPAFLTVAELGRFLMDAVDFGLGLDDLDFQISYGQTAGEDDPYAAQLSRLPTDDKTAFISRVATTVQKMEDIQFIVVNRDYSAWGEFADLIADNDQTLVKYARALLESKEDEKETIRQQMLAYINTPAPRAEPGYEFAFARGFSEIKYNWFGNAEDLDQLAQRLCGTTGPGGVSGYEYFSYNLETGAYKKEASFDLY